MGGVTIKNKFWKLIFICTAIFAPVFCSLAQMPIYEKLYVRDSAHFRYIYTQSTAPLILPIARACEDARCLLSPFFKHKIADRVIVLVADNIDIHNGWATTIPSPRMQIYLATTPPFSTIYEPGDELRRTIFHEYAHLLTMDAMYGLRRKISAVFGRVMPLGDPLSFLMAYLTLPSPVFAPAWYLEGLAIFAETEFTVTPDARRHVYGPGRGRNAMADMILRMAVRDKRQLPPQAWDLNLPEWPEGGAAYLYGMRVIQYAQETAGLDMGCEDVVGDLADSVNHAWPYWFDFRAMPVAGKTFDQLARATAVREQERQNARLDMLSRMPFTRLKRLTPERLQAESPVFSADGESVFFIGRGEADRGTICRFDFKSRQIERYPSVRIMTGTGVRLYPSSDRRYLYYSRLEYVGRDRLWKQVYRFDAQTGRECRVADAGRYGYPAISPDGQRLAAVRVEAGRHVLLEVPLRDAGKRAAERVLHAPEYGRFLLDPLYLPDGKTLVCVESDEDGTRIRRFALAEGRDDVVLDEPVVAVSLRLSADGNFLLFCADNNGVFNLYRMPANGSAPPEALTHVSGGVLDAASSPSPDDRRLVIVNYDSYGFHLAELPVSLASIGAPLPAIEPDWRADPVNQSQVAEVLAQPPDHLGAPRPYQAWRNAEFEFWSPWLTWSEGGAQGGLALTFSEPAGHHALAVLGGYDTDAETWLGNVNYDYAGWYPLLNFHADRGVQVYTELLKLDDNRCADYYETESRGGLSVTLQFERTDRRLDILAGYNWTRREGIDRKNPSAAAMPHDGLPVFDGNESVMFGGLRWFNGTAFNRSHSVEDGRLVEVMGDHAGVGGDLTRQRATGQWSEYVALPWGENHVFKLEGLGGVSRGDASAQGAFGLGGFSEDQGANRGVSRNMALRGYPRNYQTGTEAVRVTAAWRFPVWRTYRGVSSTMPVYRHQLFGELFYDGGRAWDGNNERDNPEDKWIQSAGVELNYALTLLRYVDVAPGVGVAYAFDRERRCEEMDDDVKLQLYISIKGVVNF